MNRNILISNDRVAELLRTSVRSELSAKKEEMDKIAAECSELENILNQLDDNKSSSPYVDILRPVIKNYYSNGTWVDKITAILSHYGKSLTTAEIADIITEVESRTDERGKIVGSLSAILSTKSSGESPIFMKSTNTKGENIYSIIDKHPTDE